jgi:hypothetical protein
LWVYKSSWLGKTATGGYKTAERRTENQRNGI